MAPPQGSPHELIWDRWRYFAETDPDADAIIHWIPGEEPYRWTCGRLHNAAMAMAWQLRRAGIGRGDVCALIMRHHPYVYPIYMAVASIAAIPAVLAYPNPRLHPDKFRDGLEGMSQKSGLDWILTEAALETVLRPLLHEGAHTIRDILFPLEWAGTTDIGQDQLREILEERSGIGPASPLLLQHSSGTTGLQKAIVLSHKAVLDHVALYGEAIHLSQTDKVASWLPLYHDMGLIAAFHLPLASGIPCVQIDPFQWVVSPIIQLEAITKEGCTLAWLPNFAYNLMADRIHEEDLADVRLDSLRMVINCSEPVRAESHQRFLTRFSSRGLAPGAIAACYAMAETTFAVTQTEPNVPARTLCVDRDRLSGGVAALTTEPSPGPVRMCVSSGRPIPGCEVRIVDEGGCDVPERIVGEAVVSSTSLFSGYRNNAAATAEVVKGHWLSSGDLAFAHDGEYYIVGRKKDLIIVAGKNIFPEDIEDAVSEVPGVIPGRVIAFGEDDPDLGTEQIEVVAETHLESPEAETTLKQRIVEAGMQLNLTIARVHLVPPRWLVKSSSGKPSRRATRERLLRRGA